MAVLLYCYSWWCGVSVLRGGMSIFRMVGFF